MRRLHRLVLIAVAILASAPSSSAQMDDIPCLIPRTIPDPSGPGSGGAPLGPGVQYAKRAPTRHAAERAAKPESAEEGSKATVEMEIPKVTECKPYFQLHFTEWVGHFNEYDGVSTMPVDVAVQSVGLSHVGETWRWGVTLPYVNWSTSVPGEGESGFGDTFGVVIGSFLTDEGTIAVLDQDTDRSRAKVDGWVEAMFGGSLPTGSESRHLGHGGVSISAGVKYRIGRDRLGACPEWLRPDWLFELGLAPTWTHSHFDTTTLDFSATIKTGWNTDKRAVPVFTGGVVVVAELGDGQRHFGGADPVTQIDGIVQLAWPWNPFTVAIGTRIPLNDDGLRGDPTVSITLSVRPQLVGDRPAPSTSQRSSGL